MKQIIDIKGKKYDELKERMMLIKQMIRECEDSIFTSLYFSSEFEYYKRFAGNLEFFERISNLSVTYSQIMRTKLEELYKEIDSYVILVNSLPIRIKENDKVILVSPEIAVVSDESLPSSDIIKLGINFNVHLIDKDIIESALYEAARNRLKNYSVMMTKDDELFCLNVANNKKED